MRSCDRGSDTTEPDLRPPVWWPRWPGSDSAFALMLGADQIPSQEVRACHSNRPPGCPRRFELVPRIVRTLSQVIELHTQSAARCPQVAPSQVIELLPQSAARCPQVARPSPREGAPGRGAPSFDSHHRSVMPPPIGACRGLVRSRTLLCGSIGVRIVFLHVFWTAKKVYRPVPVSRSHRCHYRSVVSRPIGQGPGHRSVIPTDR